MSFDVICFGEVLWDAFADHKKIGGAPLNVALRLQSLGAHVSIISSVGNDADGTVLTKYIKNKGIDTSLLQINESYPTSTVSVNLDNLGNATYEINYPCAWDFIEINNTVKHLVSTSDIFIFGSLTCRNSTSKNTLFELIELANFSVFDVNFRKPHYSMTVIKELLLTADFIKLNDDELHEICKVNSLEGAHLEEKIKAVSTFSSTKKICVTLGENGAVLYLNDRFYYNHGRKVHVVDTVGAGDSFLASLIYMLHTKNSPQKSIDFACEIGAIVASHEGANPDIDYSNI